MLLKLIASVLLFTLISISTFSQEDALQTDAERQADSIMRSFINEKGTDPRFVEGIDSARLEQAENDYMDNFLKLERDPKKELLHKRILQGVIGVALLSGLFIVFRRKKRKFRGDGHSSRS